MKILVLGSVASGKTTLAGQLHQRYHLPLFALDAIAHDDENHERRSLEEQIQMVNSIIKSNKDWIIEGMPRTYLDILASSATLIIYLDYPKRILKRQLRIRHLKYNLGIAKVSFVADHTLYKRMLAAITNDQRDNLMFCMKKYPTKLILLRKRSEIKKLFSAIEEGQILKYQ